MARINKSTLTKLEIISVATKKFLENGYSNTSVKAISDELEMSTGNLTFYFHSKEHLLEELIGLLCNFQREMMEKEANEGVSSIMAICLELTAMAAACDESSVAKDLYVSAYTSPLALELIRKNDFERAKSVFFEFCPNWTDEQFWESEMLVSGIEYSTFMTTPSSPSLEARISGALEQILAIYNVPKKTRELKIQKVLSMDYRALGNRVLDDFKKYVDTTNENAFANLLHT